MKNLNNRMVENIKREVLVLLSLIIGIISGYAQEGVWHGELEVRGVKLPLVFHLDGDNPTLDSPAQKANGIPAQVIRIGKDSITVRIPVIGATFAGKYENNTISGTFTQMGMEFPLILVEGERVVNRPQTPHPPFPYQQEEVSFSNGDAVLRGTLTLPDGYTPQTPVVLMVTGSGLQNRDEEIFDHKPFAVIADALARNGIASLRYDDRGYGESTGDAVNCTTEDLKNDASAGIKLLRQRFPKVGVLGHSEGGTIALMLGADKEVDFLISMAGMVVSGKELLLDQNRVILMQAGYSPEITEEYCRYLEKTFDKDHDVLSQLAESELPVELKRNLQGGLAQLGTPYMKYFLALDPREILGNVACPVLALNGKKDTQVIWENNIAALKSGLPSNDSNMIVALDGLNHLFQNCETGSTNEYASIEETISPDVLDMICSWIRGLRP